MPKPASCPHHWITLEVVTKTLDAGRIVVRLGCILCFKWADATFEPLGYNLTVETVRAQRAAKKASR